MNWSLNDLAPRCPIPHCSKYGTRHLLDHQVEIAKQIITGDEIYIYWQGGVGSAKTLLWGVLAAAYMIMVPESRIILFRKDYGLLHETLWKYFTSSIEAACEQEIIKAEPKKLFSVKKPTGYTLCTLPNGSVARAGQTKNWSEFMGPTYDAVFISDAMENNDFGNIFRGEGVVGGLQSRLRGQKSAYYTLPNGSTKDMRRFLIESNPPPHVNELHGLFGKEPGVRTLPGINITYRHIQTSSMQNDHNPASYVAEIMAMHPDAADQARILGGKTVPFYGGVRVIKTFYPEVHVHHVEVDNDLALYASIDPGTQHPAMIVGQIKRCDYDVEHFITLSEITNLYDKSTKEFTEIDDGVYLGLLAHLGLYYPQHFDIKAYMEEREALLRYNNSQYMDFSHLQSYFSRINFCIDKSSNKRNPENADKQSTRMILFMHYGIWCQYRSSLGLEKSLDRVNDSFNERCICELPIQIINYNCDMLIDAYSGGYRYAKKKDGSHGSTPIEDHRYEDPSDAHRYLLENFFFNTMLSFEEKRLKYPELELPSHAWMDRGI